MKKSRIPVLSMVCLCVALAMLLPAACLAETRAAKEIELLEALADALTSELDRGTSVGEYDGGMDAIVITFNLDLPDWEWSISKPAAKSSFVESLKGLYDAAQETLTLAGVDGVEIYIMAFTSDGTLIYLGVNGNDITGLVS